MKTYGGLINEAIWADKAKADAGEPPYVIGAPPVMFCIDVLSIDLSKPVSSFNFTGLPVELQIVILEFLDFVELSSLSTYRKVLVTTPQAVTDLFSRSSHRVTSSAIKERIANNLTPRLRATLFRSVHSLELLNEGIKRQEALEWPDCQEPTEDLRLHPILDGTKSTFGITRPKMDRFCVVEGRWGRVYCPFADLVEMDDNATEPACAELRLDMWNILWRSFTSSMFDHQEDAEHFQPVKFIVKGKEGNAVKVRDVLDGMLACLKYVRSRMDWNTYCSTEEMVISDWSLYGASTSGRLVLEDVWDSCQ